jgi:ABC-type transport system involved in Fe-S cluster assembly fused permease/ATPase subunit
MIKHGIVVINKEQNYTSHDVTAIVKRTLRMKAGHTGTLDPVAEAEVYSKMNEIVGGKTAVFISHRLSSCRFCQDIAVFHEGRLIQRGSHNRLIADEDGKYYELWNAQAQYYTE